MYGAEWLNKLGSRTWKAFATQDYFDRHGVFMSVMFSMPLVLMSLAMLIHMLVSAGKLLIKVKRFELKESRRGQQQGEGEENGRGARS